MPSTSARCTLSGLFLRIATILTNDRPSWSRLEKRQSGFFPARSEIASKPPKSLPRLCDVAKLFKQAKDLGCEWASSREFLIAAGRSVDKSGNFSGERWIPVVVH